MLIVENVKYFCRSDPYRVTQLQEASQAVGLGSQTPVSNSFPFCSCLMLYCNQFIER